MKVKVLLDSTFKSGLILHGPAPVRYAYDGLGHAKSHPPEASHLQLHKGVNEVEADEIEAWRGRAADAGLIINKANDVYVLTNALAGARVSAPIGDGTPTSTVLERALASDIVVSAR